MGVGVSDFFCINPIHGTLSEQLYNTLFYFSYFWMLEIKIHVKLQIIVNLSGNGSDSDGKSSGTPRSQHRHDFKG